MAVLYWYYSRHALDVDNPLPVIRISSIVLPNLSGKLSEDVPARIPYDPPEVLYLVEEGDRCRAHDFLLRR